MRSLLSVGGIVRITLLTLVWIMLREDFSLIDVIVGVAIAIGCITYSRKFLPIKKTGNIKAYRLIFYLFYVLGQIYLAGFVVLMRIITGNARSDIVMTHTFLNDESLRVILADSITLTPGSILLDLTDTFITVVILVDKDAPDPLPKPDSMVKGQLENKLLRIEGKSKEEIQVLAEIMEEEYV